MPEIHKAHISELVPDDKNANKGTERGADMLTTSLQQYGAGRSILIDKNKKIIAGNKTVENAGMAGIEGVIIVPTDGTKLIAVQRTDLDMDTDPRARELGVMDNRTSEVGLEWDAETLKELQDEGADLGTMFSDSELAEIMKGLEDVAPPDDFQEVDENIPTKHKCPQCGYEWSNEGKA